jgi:predicted nuclease of predicted toxin-antitoxin system
LRILLDAWVPKAVRDDLMQAGHDVVWAGDWTTDPGDDEILHQAHRESRVLVTIDKDFGELAVVRGQPHSGIVRLVAMATSRQVDVCAAVLKKYGAELEAGAIVTAESGRVRVRPGS